MPAYCISGPSRIQNPVGERQPEHQYHSDSWTMGMWEIWAPGSLLRGGRWEAHWAESWYERSMGAGNGTWIIDNNLILALTSPKISLRDWRRLPLTRLQTTNCLTPRNSLLFSSNAKRPLMLKVPPLRLRPILVSEISPLQILSHLFVPPHLPWIPILICKILHLRLHSLLPQPQICFFHPRTWLGHPCS